MISLQSAWAVTLRHLRLWRHDPNFLIGAFYWPVLDILVWGFVGTWIGQTHISEFQNYETVALLGVLLWQCVGRGSNSLIVCFSEELWSENLINLFSLPLRINEWILGVCLLTGIAMAIISTFSILICILFYNVDSWDLISTFCIFAGPLFICGIWISFMALQIIVLFGKRTTELGFVVAWFLLPFSGAYYPIEVLPIWAQKLSTWIPMSHLFNGMRMYLMQKQSPVPYLIKGSVLATVYAIGAIVLFKYCFKISKKRGLTRLMD